MLYRIIRWDLDTPYLTQENMSEKEIRAEYAALRDIIPMWIPVSNPAEEKYVDHSLDDFE